MVAKNILSGNGPSTSQPLKKNVLHSSQHMADGSGVSAALKSSVPKSQTNSYGPILSKDGHHRGFSHNSSLVAHLDNKSKIEGTERPSGAVPLSLNIAN